MTASIPAECLVGLEDAPSEVKALLRPDVRPPESDPTLGIPVTVDRSLTPRHRLVAIGDSLTHGFHNGSLINTSLSYPSLIARELGWSDSFRYPVYPVGPAGGLPLDLEKLARELGNRFAVEDGINAIDFVSLFPWIRNYLDQNEDFWERGLGKNVPESGPINHNLAVYGWDLRNTLARTADIAKAAIQKNRPKDDFLRQVVENDTDLAALYVLNTARDQSGTALTPVQAATALGAEGSLENGQGDGIETLIVIIGANNVLGSILTFKVAWSGEDYTNMAVNDKYTVWLPSHFNAEFDRILEQVRQTRARHVIWATVPHVTIPPFTRGIHPGQSSKKVQQGSRYYPYYIPFWQDEKTFNPRRHPHLTANQARAIDSVIDEYNRSIVAAVRQGRQEGRDWYVFELVSVLDQLAFRRYIQPTDPANHPSWWKEYELPPALKQLNPPLTTEFFVANSQGRQKGGLFSLDGLHPTTIGYGIMAQEIINIMQLAGVSFLDGNGNPRTGKVEIDFDRLIQEDSLISNPPPATAALLDFVRWLDTNTGLISQLYGTSV